MQKFKFLSKDKDDKHKSSNNTNSSSSNHNHSNSSNKKKRNKHQDILANDDTLSMLSEQRRLISRNAIVSSSGKVIILILFGNKYFIHFFPRQTNRTNFITIANVPKSRFGMWNIN